MGWLWPTIKGKWPGSRRLNRALASSLHPWGTTRPRCSGRSSTASCWPTPPAWKASRTRRARGMCGLRKLARELAGGRGVEAGENFGDLSSVHSLDLSTRPGGGDLGWFAEGQLTTPELESAAFGMNPGDLSQVVQSDLGFHIVEVLQREPRPLYGEALERHRFEAVRSWLDPARLAAETGLWVEP